MEGCAVRFYLSPELVGAAELEPRVLLRWLYYVVLIFSSVALLIEPSAIKILYYFI
jgi:hypothetical protein